jgi:hypothetical protein
MTKLIDDLAADLPDDTELSDDPSPPQDERNPDDE